MGDNVHEGVEGSLGGLVQRGVVAACSRICGLEWGSADLAEQSAGEKVIFPCHPPCHVRIEVVVLDAGEDVLAHPVYSLGATCENDVLLFNGNVDTLYLVCLGW